MALCGEGAICIWNGITDEGRAEFYAWHNGEHMPERVGIPGFRRGTDTQMKINLTGAMTGSRANVFIEPRKDGPTTIKMRFHELKEAPAGLRLALEHAPHQAEAVRALLHEASTRCDLAGHERVTIGTASA